MIPRQTAPPDETAMDHPGALILCMPPAFFTGTAINSGEDFFCNIRAHHESVVKIDPFAAGWEKTSLTRLLFLTFVI